MHIVPLMADWDGHDGDLQPPLCSSLEKKQLYHRKSWERILISVVSQSQDYACVNDITLASSTFFSTYIWTEKFMNWSCWKSQITGPVRVICRCRFPPEKVFSITFVVFKVGWDWYWLQEFQSLKKVFDTFSFQEFKILSWIKSTRIVVHLIHDSAAWSASFIFISLRKLYCANTLDASKIRWGHSNFAHWS